MSPDWPGLLGWQISSEGKFGDEGVDARIVIDQLDGVLRELPVDDSNPVFFYDPNKCVLCGRCVRLCRQRRETAILGFAHRGFKRTVTTFADEPIGGNRCLECHDCVSACPTGALSFKDEGTGSDTTN